MSSKNPAFICPRDGELTINLEISRKALLGQLAEECCELAQACLKLVREIDGENKPFRSLQEMEDNLEEEFTDVMLVADRLGLDVNEHIYAAKNKRWNERIAITKVVSEDGPLHSERGADGVIEIPGCEVRESGNTE